MVQGADMILVSSRTGQPPGIGEQHVGLCRTKWEIACVENAQKEVTGLTGPSLLRVLLDTLSSGPTLLSACYTSLVVEGY